MYKATVSFIDPLTGDSYRIGEPYVSSDEEHAAYLLQNDLIIGPVVASFAKIEPDPDPDPEPDPKPRRKHNKDGETDGVTDGAD